MNFIERIKYIFFPKRCVLCQKPILPDESCCEKCLFMMQRPKNRILKLMHGSNLDGFSYVYDYSDYAALKIKQLKTPKHVHCADFFADELYKEIKKDFINIHFDAVMYVPKYREEKEDVYNQSYELAERISKISGVPLYKHGIVQIAPKEPQHTMGWKKRLVNVSEKYAINAQVLEMNILLVDDVVTTGATLDVCAALLKKGGALSVYAAAPTRTTRK